MSNRILVSTRKGLFTFDQTDASWAITQTAFLGDPVTLTMTEDGGEKIRAALDLGHFGCKIQESTDAGETWREAPCPEYPAKPEGKDDIDPVQQKPMPWDLKKIWAFGKGGDKLWCGTIPGGLFLSRDDGKSWSIVDSLWSDPLRSKWFGGGTDYPGIHSIVVDPQDSDHVTVGVSCGGVWKTRDGGETWSICAKGMRANYMPPTEAFDEAIQDPHMIVSCPTVPEVMWCQHHNGIFVTRDDCTSWQEIEDVTPSTFGFAVAVHPRNPDRAWFIPAVKDEARYPTDGKLLVNRTSDGGKTFEALTKGLPQSHSYDLIYRHALAIDESGERLVFGSTTGSLWITKNGGDTWDTLSNYLPPIYAVQFA
ncbi:MAG: photosystem II stability/assembly factor-like uncharacterized protein [Planctomycetota bacterium]|jgi:photosystem II stability/assembly factor-like uncharacterized protein